MDQQTEQQVDREMAMEEHWLDLRDRAGKLYARFDPLREVLEIRQRGETVRFQLEHYRFQIRG